MLTKEQLSDKNYLLGRGWRMWANTVPVLYLCPASDYEYVPDGTIMVSINGKEYIKGKDYIDDDTRGGLLAYGVLI
jgi:hypothetical protein